MWSGAWGQREDSRWVEWEMEPGVTREVVEIEIEGEGKQEAALVSREVVEV